MAREARISFAAARLRRTARTRAEAAGTRTAKAAVRGGPPGPPAAVRRSHPQARRARRSWTAIAGATPRPWSAEAPAGARRPARPPIFARTGFADRERPAHEQLTVELLDGRFRDGAVGVFHESKSARPPGLAIEGPHDLRGLTDRGEVHPQVFFAGLIREITYEQSDWRHGIVEGGKSAVGPL